jgi:feruloyl-CoA synthase
VPVQPDFLTPHILSTPTPGGLVLRAAAGLPEPARCVGDWLVRWAGERPEATFLAERGADGSWARVTYAEALAVVEALGSSLLALGGRPDRPVMILSDNSVDGALLSLAACHVGIPVSPVSPAYSLLSQSFDRLRDVASQLRPGFVFADEPERFGGALRAMGSLGLEGVTVLASKGGGAHRGLDELGRSARPGECRRSAALEQAFAKVGPDTIAKVLFTSGSTGRPKGVVNTQRMLTANQESMAACWPFLDREAPVVVDWLPWSHTFGGNHNFFMVLRNGGSLFLDRGRPAPGLVETTLKNLADVSPTLWFNVPRGFDQAVAVLEESPEIAEAVFRNLRLVFYAAAALSPSTRARLEKVAEAAGRPDVFFTSAWGSTETAPLATSAHFPTRTTGILGVPVPGVELKLAPVQDRLELRVKGPNVTPGYWQAGGTVAPIDLDEEGFLRTGDAGRLADEGRPEEGVVFVGRLSENFKLSSGTWVNVAHVRLSLVEACAPLVLDAVIAGHDRPGLGALLFLSPAAKGLDPSEVRARIAAGLGAHDRRHTGNSERVERALVLEEPLSLDAGETTDKGYTNQRRVLERRAADVERLFGEPGPEMLRPNAGQLAASGGTSE